MAPPACDKISGLFVILSAKFAFPKALKYSADLITASSEASPLRSSTNVGPGSTPFLHPSLKKFTRSLLFSWFDVCASNTLQPTPASLSKRSSPLLIKSQTPPLKTCPKSLRALAKSQGSKSKIKSGIKDKIKLIIIWINFNKRPNNIDKINFKINLNISKKLISGIVIFIGNNLKLGIFKSGKLQKSKFLISQEFKYSDHSSK